MKQMSERKRLSIFKPIEPSPEEILVAMANRADRENALDAVKVHLLMMSPRVRQALVMTFGLDGQCHDCDEIAQVTGYKAKVIPLIINRAIHQLRQAVV